jgi:hypothetical protein
VKHLGTPLDSSRKCLEGILEAWELGDRQKHTENGKERNRLVPGEIGGLEDWRLSEGSNIIRIRAVVKYRKRKSLMKSGAWREANRGIRGIMGIEAQRHRKGEHY